MAVKESPLWSPHEGDPEKETRSEVAGVTVLQFRRLSAEPGLVHAVFTRQGGVSDRPYHSLNTSYSTGDHPERVTQNIEIIREAMAARELVFMNQAHGKSILVLSRCSPSPKAGPDRRADAMITDRPHTALMVKQADCQGVILYEPSRRVVALVHCGWRGNTLNILGSVVARMESDFGCRAGRMLAAVGPSLGPCCGEFRSYRQIFPKSFTSFMVRESYFDLWRISRWQLLEAGLEEENIAVAGICTRCRTDLFFSYRAEGLTGRFATAVMLT
ncbi:MAG: peptidoglycan editing factor PgeF [Deltaproteobacteria bacterium]|nr:peptidoglycan editing factor PgeF [Deltaproteobacteria bacterium]